MDMKEGKFTEADLENGRTLSSKTLSDTKTDSFEESQSESCPSTVESMTTFESPSVAMTTSTEENVHENPFECRQGKTLTWRNVNMKLRKKNGDCLLLDNVWGEVPKQEITAIMGPSGAGKTTLLNVLAGRVRSRGPITITSDIRLNNYSVNPTKMSVRKQIAFVAQDDSLQITSTPRECIRFSARLRLSRQTSDEDIDKLVEKMLAELGLLLCADTYIGGPLLKGVSGGERKRTSVGVELVVKPSLVFLDEPTSGLDSYSALQVVQVLKKVASAGASVLFTIHQPSSAIFNSLDHIILLKKGRVMFEGRVSVVNSVFAERGNPVPPNYNPADWIMHIAQAIPMTELEDKGFFPKDHRIAPNPSSDMSVAFPTRRDKKTYKKAHSLTQIRLLLQRDYRDMVRNTYVTGARLALTIAMSALVGALYYKVGTLPTSDLINFQSHFGALVMILMLGMFGTALPALLAIPDERPVFLREYSTNHYSVLSYFAARFFVEAIITFLQVFLIVAILQWTIGMQTSFLYLLTLTYAISMSSTALAVWVGCAISDPQLGYQLLPVVYVPQLLLSGFFVNTDLIPPFIRFMQYLCPLTYAVRIGLVSEFKDCGLTCDMFLYRLNAREDEVWWYWVSMLALFFNCRIFGLLVLKKKATSFF